MDYFGIIAKAFRITWKNRYLWIFGILIAGVQGANFVTYTWPETQNAKLSQFFLSNIPLIIALAGLIFLIWLAWLILSINANGAIIGSVKALAGGQKSDFHKGFKIGWEYFWRVFLAYLAFIGIIIFAVTITGLPIGLLIWAKAPVLAIIFGILLGILDIALFIYLALIFPYALRILVIKDLGVWQSLRKAGELFTKEWGEIVVMYLLLWLVGMGVGVAYLFILLIVGGLLFGIGFAIYLSSISAALIYACIASLVFLAVLTFVSGLIATFNSSVITLTYLAITEKKS